MSWLYIDLVRIECAVPGRGAWCRLPPFWFCSNRFHSLDFAGGESAFLCLYHEP